MRMLASNLLSSKDSFLLGLMGQHGTSHHISNCQNARNVSLQIVVYYHSSLFVSFHSSFIKPKALSKGSSASGHQNVVSLKDLAVSSLNRLNIDFGISSVILSAGDLVSSQNFNSLLCEDFVESLSELFIERRAYFVQEFDDSDVGAESLVD